VSAAVIIAQIESTGSVFSLTTEDILILTDEGVSQSVIEAMIRTGEAETDRGNRPGYRTRYDEDYDGYSYGYDRDYRVSLAVVLGYHDPWWYYYPWGAYYVACYPYYRTWWHSYYSWAIYDPWYYWGHHYYYPRYDYRHVRMDEGRRHQWDRPGPGRGDRDSRPPYVRANDKPPYHRPGPGVTARPSVKQKPVLKPDPGRGKPAKPRVKSESTYHRPEPGRTGQQKPPAPPPQPPKEPRKQDNDRHYGSRPSGTGRSR
jgi:hypothetical protein